MSDRLEQCEEVAIAMAQSEVALAMRAAGVRVNRLAEIAGWQPSFVSKMLRGGCNPTVRTIARAVAACGYELRFSIVPIPAALPEKQREEPNLMAELAASLKPGGTRG
jgi:transcriptional regulator with XRE-family HTH domain